MSLKCGIVGLPNVGKSTLFNALTKAGIAAENYPFCTIEPNVGVVEVPDTRLKDLSLIVKPERVVPAIVEFVDIAGLVAGASQGEGLGNQFLAHIRETDAIVNVVRCFDDDNIIHVAGRRPVGFGSTSRIPGPACRWASSFSLSPGSARRRAARKGPALAWSLPAGSRRRWGRRRRAELCRGRQHVLVGAGR